jgi:hypothetical protein
MKVEVVIPEQLAHCFAKVRHNEVRLYDRRSKRLAASVLVPGPISDGDTITLSSITFSIV